MIKFLSQFWPVTFSTRKELETSDDIAYRDAFVTSHLALTIEKDMRNRIAQHNDTVLAHAGKTEAMIAKGKMEELEDILLGWKHLREDLEKKHAK